MRDVSVVKAEKASELERLSPAHRRTSSAHARCAAPESAAVTYPHSSSEATPPSAERRSRQQAARRSARMASAYGVAPESCAAASFTEATKPGRSPIASGGAGPRK